ncbi:MAG: TIGR04211 family SH3 domain-containing protein [Pseudomonadota bacterium]
MPKTKLPIVKLNTFQVAFIVFVMLAPFLVHAQTAYVIDQLLVGLHAEKNLDSAITKVLPTGTALDVLERDGELAKVRDTAGNEGWIDAAYLMDTRPARIRVNELEQSNTQLKAELEAVRNAEPSSTTTTETGEGGRSETVDKLTNENTELKRKLSAEMVNNAQLTEKLNTAEAKLGDRPISPAETRVTELESEITSLKRELENSLQDNKTLKAHNRQSLSDAIPSVNIEAFSWPVAVAILILALIAYGLGIYTMDYLNRRRHGGFRV